MRTPKKETSTYDYDDLKLAIEKSHSYSEVLRYFGKNISSKSMNVLRRWITKHGLDDSGLKQWMSNKVRAKRLAEYLVLGSTISSSDLKRKLYAAGLKKEVCEECNQLPEWNGKKLVLQLDHVNGNNRDNRIENVKILCPNCHTQTATFGKGMSKLTRMRDKEEEKAQSKQMVLVDRSKNGGRTSKEMQSQLLSRKVERPSYDKLVEMVKELGYCEVGRIHGVSDNAIRKWIRTYEKQNVNFNTTVV